MPDTPRRYWDACVFLSYVNGIPDRLPDIDALLEEARDGTIEFLTSSVSITEVAYGVMEQTGEALDWTVDEEIDRLWTPPSPIQIVEFYRSVAYGAKRLVRREWPNNGS
jgi:hypothetical protein